MNSSIPNFRPENFFKQYQAKKCNCEHLKKQFWTFQKYWQYLGDIRKVLVTQQRSVCVRKFERFYYSVVRQDWVV